MWGVNKIMDRREFLTYSGAVLVAFVLPDAEPKGSELEYKLNFNLGKETLNKRFYDPILFKREIKDTVEKGGLHVVDQVPSDWDGYLVVKDIIGSVVGVRYLVDGSVFFKVKKFRDHVAFSARYLTTLGRGAVDPSGEVIDFKLIALAFTN